MVFILVNDQCGVGDDSSGGRGQRHGNTADGYKNTSRDLHRCILISEDFLLHGRFHQARLAAALLPHCFAPNYHIKYNPLIYCEGY